MQLLEVAAHDLRNPISGILAAGQYLVDDAGSVLDEHHLALLESIDSSGRSMLRLIDDVIELSHIESGTLRLDIQATDIQPLLHRALLSSQPAADRKKIKLDVLTGTNGPLPALDIDPARIFRALDSLVTNTIKLTRAGSRIEVIIGARAGKATISLRTDGSSIAARDLRALFNPFRKSRVTRPGVESGTALGLGQGEADHRSSRWSDAGPRRQGNGVDDSVDAAAGSTGSRETCDCAQSCRCPLSVGSPEDSWLQIFSTPVVSLPHLLYAPA